MIQCTSIIFVQYGIDVNMRIEIIGKMNTWQMAILQYYKLQLYVIQTYKIRVLRIHAAKKSRIVVWNRDFFFFKSNLTQPK